MGIRAVEMMPSWTRVERLSYEEALGRMDEPLFARLEEKMDPPPAAPREKRRDRHRPAGGAGQGDPAGEVEIHPILPLRSRLMVEEAMILAGEAAARFALEHGIPFAFSTQDAR